MLLVTSSNDSTTRAQDDTDTPHSLITTQDYVGLCPTLCTVKFKYLHSLTIFFNERIGDYKVCCCCCVFFVTSFTLLDNDLPINGMDENEIKHFY